MKKVVVMYVLAYAVITWCHQFLGSRAAGANCSAGSGVAWKIIQQRRRSRRDQGKRLFLLSFFLIPAPIVALAIFPPTPPTTTPTTQRRHLVHAFSLLKTISFYRIHDSLEDTLDALT
ncbi:hypothetical protein M408DRAFT_189951 [Serendipita vermifera MAFF 305830]|uniref:Uncharacterized protein n=1 Tax=Serendipita vermifera MAFF 305830 TaxID=933852 RepID=A0A0C3BLM9_SERVB|nr:hypothetical protein M408DRAFT_189951 [Serendipita vermifera MAFF 305830]